MSKKNMFWQIVRAICILAVIAIHCPNALNLSHSTFQFHLYVIVRALVNFPVAVFLFLAGYFINQEKCLADKRTFFLNRGGVRLLIPYIVWSAIYMLVSRLGGDQLGASEIVWKLLTGKSAGPLYYVVVLIQLTLLTPYLISCALKKSSWPWLITPAALVIVYVFAYRAEGVPWYCDTLFPLWFGFYYLGIRLRTEDIHITSFLKKMGSIPCVLLSFLINLVESELLIHNGITTTLAVSQNRIGGFLYALAIVGLFYRLSGIMNCKKNLLVWLGDNSYAIYFTHYLVLKIVTKTIGPRLHDMWTPYFGICFVSTLVMTSLIVGIVKLFARKVRIQSFLKYIGY